MTPCLPEGRDCYKRPISTNSSCLVNCDGIYADIQFVKSSSGEKRREKKALQILIEAYNAYKEAQVKNLVLEDNLRPRVGRVPYKPLQVVQIYFSTATYDKIVNDVSVTLGDQISAIGGTMGLFAGFSILSVVEILYFLLKFLLTLIMKARMKS